MALRAWAGSPSFTEIARRVTAARTSRGVPVVEARLARSTAYDCFRHGRRRIDVDLTLEIVRALGVATKERVAVLPDLPTMTEQGAPVEVGAWFGFFMPAGTPPTAVAWLNRETTRILSAPDASGRFTSQGAAVPLGTPEQFASFVKAESDRYGDVIKRAGIKLE